MFFSIVIATRNAAQELPALLQSLAEQTCRNFEVLIQDGGSKDSTLAIAESFRHQLPILSIQSQKDRCVFEAWNNALPRATGSWILFLGADDRLADPNVLEKTIAVLEQAPKQVLFGCGAINFVYPDGTFVEGPRWRDLERTPDFLQRGEVPVDHSALFHRTTLFTSARFDMTFKVVGDQELLARVWTRPEQGTNLGFLVTLMAHGGISSQRRFHFTVRREYFRIALRYTSITEALRVHYPRLWRSAISHACLCFLGKKATEWLLSKYWATRPHNNHYAP